MGRHRAVIVGCGRIGVGRDMRPTPFPYNHLVTYERLHSRVALVGVADRVRSRAQEVARARAGVEFSDDVSKMLASLAPDIVSICTPPSDREEILRACATAGSVKGIWCEKPYWTDYIPPGIEVQVDYIRRFDSRHRVVAASEGRKALIAVAANDIHTTPHFTDLARFWNVQKEDFRYVPFFGPSMYVLRMAGMAAGRYRATEDRLFRNGGVSGDFMARALLNLLDAVEGRKPLSSPASSAIISENWAREIIG